MVRALRALARKLGVEETCTDETGRAAVTSLMQRVRGVTGHRTEKKEAEKLWLQYDKTFQSTASGNAGALSDNAATGTPTSGNASAASGNAPSDNALSGNELSGISPSGNEDKCRLRGKSFLLTYNWDFLGRAFPDSTAAAATSEDLWNLWRAWRKSKKRELGGKTRVLTCSGKPCVTLSKLAHQQPSFVTCNDRRPHPHTPHTSRLNPNQEKKVRNMR